MRGRCGGIVFGPIAAVVAGGVLWLLLALLERSAPRNSGQRTLRLLAVLREVREAPAHESVAHLFGKEMVSGASAGWQARARRAPCCGAFDPRQGSMASTKRIGVIFFIIGIFLTNRSAGREIFRVAEGSNDVMSASAKSILVDKRWRLRVQSFVGALH